MFIDPSMNTMGWAIYELSRVNFQVQSRLKSFGLVTPTDPDASAQDRICCVVNQMLALYQQHKCRVAIIEKPPDTIYGANKMKPFMVVARAQSIFKVYAVALAIYSAFRAEQCQMVLPSQWEPSKKERGGRDIKEWSLLNANLMLQRTGFQEKLKTKVDENIADAISLGERMIPYLLAGKLPNAG